MILGLKQRNEVDKYKGLTEMKKKNKKKRYLKEENN